MTMKSILLASTAVFALSAAAFAADNESYESNTKIEKDSAGNYSEKDTVTKTDANGTTNSSKKTLKIAVDAKGNTDKIRITETVIDPKGLGNKHVVATKDTEKTKYGMVDTTHTKTVNGKNVEGTKDNYKSTSKIQKDSEGNYAERDITTNTDANGTTTSFEKDANVAVDPNGDVNKSTTTEKVTNPKGLFNKNTTVKTSNTEQTKDGMVKTSQDVTVDGKTVASKSETTQQ